MLVIECCYCERVQAVCIRLTCVLRLAAMTRMAARLALSGPTTSVGAFRLRVVVSMAFIEHCVARRASVGGSSLALTALNASATLWLFVARADASAFRASVRVALTAL